MLTTYRVQRPNSITTSLVYWKSPHNRGSLDIGYMKDRTTPDKRGMLCTYVKRGRVSLQTYGFCIGTYGETSKCHIILRRESNIRSTKFLVLIHFACPCKNYGPKCSQKPQWLHYFYKNSFIPSSGSLSDSAMINPSRSAAEVNGYIYHSACAQIKSGGADLTVSQLNIQLSCSVLAWPKGHTVIVQWEIHQR